MNSINNDNNDSNCKKDDIVGGIKQTSDWLYTAYKTNEWLNKMIMTITNNNTQRRQIGYDCDEDDDDNYE